MSQPREIGRSTFARAVIKAQGLYKSYPLRISSLFLLWLGAATLDDTIQVLKGIGVEVQPGQMLGVLGRNGAGKSTLLRVLAGIYQPDQGAVSIDGNVAGLFELGGLGNGHLTGREFVERHLRLFGEKRDQRASLSAEIAEFSEIGEYFDEKILSYSTGMAARLYFATATAVSHDVYLIDEILSVGDEHFQAKSWARIRERLTSGASGVLVTHDWAAVVRLCREACILEEGRVSVQGPADQVVASYLELPQADTGRARIVAPASFSMMAGEDLNLVFRVILFSDVDAQIGISVEALTLGIGWEPVFISEFAAVGHNPGEYEVRVSVRQAPLRPGTYKLALFLTEPATDLRPRKPLHVLSWTYGNGLDLEVKGTPRDDLAPFPVYWQEVQE